MAQPIVDADIVGIIATLLVPALDVPLTDLGRAVPSGSAVQALLEVMQGEGSALLDWVAADEQGPGELSRALAEHFCRYVRRHNQYLELGLDHRALLAELYDSVLDDIRRLVRLDLGAEALTNRLGQLLARHYASLEAMVRGLGSGQGTPEAFLESEPVCAEYSVTLQLAVLGVHPADLHQPVLDIGCGTEGALVHYLREHGVNAVGIDLSVPGEPPLIQADWMTFAYGDGRWGSILAHMSFTNHFVLQDRWSEEQAERYGLVYMKILRALAPSGAFYYAPGVPFIEQHLPDKFQVTRQPVVTMAGPPAGNSQLQVAAWQQTLCAVRVRRLG